MRVPQLGEVLSGANVLVSVSNWSYLSPLILLLRSVGPRSALTYLAKRSRHAFTEARTLSGLVPPKLVRDATELSTPSTE